MRLFDAIVGPIAVLLVFVPLWPLILSTEFNLPWRTFKFWSGKPEEAVAWTWPDPEPEFEVSNADLLEKLSRADIEANERVDDPLRGEEQAAALERLGLSDARRVVYLTPLDALL